MPYTYRREADGTDETFDVRTPNGELLTSVHFWDDAGYAEAKARLIVKALNAHRPTLFDAVKSIVSEHDKAMNINEKTA